MKNERFNVVGIIADNTPKSNKDIDKFRKVLSELKGKGTTVFYIIPRTKGDVDAFKEVLKLDNGEGNIRNKVLVNSYGGWSGITEEDKHYIEVNADRIEYTRDFPDILESVMYLVVFTGTMSTDKYYVHKCLDAIKQGKGLRIIETKGGK